MYLSRVEIRHRQARNPYNVHCCLWTLFPGQPRESRKDNESSRQGFLYRFENRSFGRPTRILLQSRLEPTPSDKVSLLNYREIDPTPKKGQVLAFLLTGNPIKTIKDTEKTSKLNKTREQCRVPLVREEEQIDWLSRKFSGAASLETVTVRPHEPLYFRKGKKGGKLVPVTFEGLIKVQDSGGLRKHLENGLGPAKAFGCGLLLLRRVS